MFNQLSFLCHVMKAYRLQLFFLCRIISSDKCVFHVLGMQKLRESYFGHRKPKRNSIAWTTQLKVTVFCAVHTIGVVDLYLFNHETVRVVDYSQMMDPTSDHMLNNSYWKLFSRPIELHFSLHANSVLIWLKYFSNSCIGRYGPVGWSTTTTTLTPLDFVPQWILEWSRVSDFSA